MANAFIFNSTTKFSWKKGAGLDLCRSDGVRQEIQRHIDTIYSRANSQTKQFNGMRNANYYKHVALTGKNNVLRGSVACGNPASNAYNYAHNILLKSMR